MLIAHNCCSALFNNLFRRSDILCTSIFIFKLNLSTSKKLKHENSLKQSYTILGLSEDCDNDTLRLTFIHLAKQYHPDGVSITNDSTKFTEIESAYRMIQRHRNSKQEYSNNPLPDIKEFDIKHIAPQHRHFLTYDTGIGTLSERQRRHTIQRAQKASENVTEHRLKIIQATERNTLVGMDKTKACDIKTRYGIERLVEDLIQEAMNKGEFSDLPGMGKPLKDRFSAENPYVDFVTHKMNEILIDNGFIPEWIQLSKEIRQEVQDLEKELSISRDYLGAIPLSTEDTQSWQNILNNTQDTVKRINNKINKYNLLVPILQKQIVQINLIDIAAKILAKPPSTKSKQMSLKTSRSNTVTTENVLISLLNVLISSFTRNKS